MNKSIELKSRIKWGRWINHISVSSSSLLVDDYIFNKLISFLRDNKSYTKEFNKWIIRIYISHATVSIRRFLDNDCRTYSLILLLSEIMNNLQFINRDAFIRSYPKRLRLLAEADFNNFAGKKNQYLPKESLLKDINKLKNISKRIRPIVDKVIAHRERKFYGKISVSFNDIHKSIIIISDICLKYNSILNHEATDSMLPSINASNVDIEIKYLLERIA